MPKHLVSSSPYSAASQRATVNLKWILQRLYRAWPTASRPRIRVYVIGADQENKRFVKLKNQREFDAANVGQILAKYLDPVPDFAVSKSGQQFAAVVVAADQPRPVVAKISAQASDGRTELLRAGDVWVKRNTALTLTARADLEAMYAVRIEAEAERRSQQRFAVTRDALEATLRIQSTSQPQTPTEDLILGPDSNYEAYVEQIFASQDELRFRMLLPVLRRFLIERWHKLKAYGSYSSEPGTELIENISTHFTDIGDRDCWQGAWKLRDTDDSLRFPSGSFASDCPLYRSKKKTREEPLLFWPIRQNVPSNDRIAYAWEHAVNPYWIRFFGSDKSFFDAACILEFIILLNSDLALTISESTQWLAQVFPNLDMTYSSDLWRYPMDSCVPLAEEIFQANCFKPGYANDS